MRYILAILWMTAAHAGEQSIEWNDNSQHEDGFYIYRSIDGINFERVGQTAKNISKFTDKEVPVGHQVSYRVTAYNRWGESLPSNTLVIGSEVPKSPSKLRKQ